MGQVRTDWSDDPDGTAEEYWLDLCGEVDESGNYWWHAAVRFDGCIHLHRAYNTPFNKDSKPGARTEDTDYFHICNLGEMIERLQKLKEEAEAHFGSDWIRPLVFAQTPPSLLNSPHETNKSEDARPRDEAAAD